MVSFQSSKHSPIHRWFKYREGYSEALVKYYIKKLSVKPGKCLDPFAGSGTTAFASSQFGFDNTLIELLPIGNFIIKVKISAHSANQLEVISHIRSFILEKPWKRFEYSQINYINITKKAFSLENDVEIGKFQTYTNTLPKILKDIYDIALLSILESISFTRKDGQYLRWDARSGKSLGNFHKGAILSFEEAIVSKLKDIADDLDKEFGLFGEIYKDNDIGKIDVLEGSCLKIMPQLKEDDYELVFTSPPYANRYDYTRTYALELALLGCNDAEIKELRQTMLSCTVENRKKNLINMNPDWRGPSEYAENHPLVVQLIKRLNEKAAHGNLNNVNIIGMLENYIREMACIIYEGYRLLKDGGYFVMVNDNVRYSGLDIPIDLILSEIASYCGFKVVQIDALPIHKGNSSQQMGEHGKSSLRKCVYIWRKP